jgi:hypothetical protein
MIAQIVRRLHAHAGLQIAPGNLLGRDDDLRQWRNHAAREQQANQRGKDSQDKGQQDKRHEEIEGKSPFRPLHTRLKDEFSNQLTIDHNGGDRLPGERFVWHHHHALTNRSTVIDNNTIMRIEEDG